MENKDKKVDRRIIRTKKSIRNAFAELLTQKDINEITIKDIADTANINRKTFYNYYSGVYQVIDEIEDEIVSEFSSIMGEIEIERDLQNPYNIFAKLTAVINNDIDFYGHLLRMGSNSTLLPKITEALKENIKLSFSSQTFVDSQTWDTVADFVLSGMLAVYQNWFNSNKEHSIEEVAKTVSIFTAFGMNGIINL